MWTDWIPAAVLVAIITGAATIYGVRKTRQSAKEANDINGADMLIKNLSADVKALRERADKTDVKLEQQAEQIKQLQTSEWTLRRYVRVLIDKIRDLGGEPPDPPPDVSF